MVSLLETVPIPLPPAPSEPQFYRKGRAEKSNSFTTRPGSLETEHWQSKWQSHQAWGSANLRLSSCSGLALDQKTCQDLLVLRDETTPVPLINSLQISQLDQILHRHHRHHPHTSYQQSSYLHTQRRCKEVQLKVKARADMKTARNLNVFPRSTHRSISRVWMNASLTQGQPLITL